MKELLAIIVAGVGAVIVAFFSGRKSEKEKQENDRNKNLVKKITDTKKRRAKRAGNSSYDDLKWLQDHNSD